MSLGDFVAGTVGCLFSVAVFAVCVIVGLAVLSWSLTTLGLL